jgi:hypothetical protein
MAPRITKRTWYWIGAAVLAAALIWLFWQNREAFQNVTDQGTAFVVDAQLDTLTSVATMKTIGALQTGTYSDRTAVATIEDYKGTEVWKAGQAPSTTTTRAQYKLKFPSTINFTKFQSTLPTGLTYIGPDFTSPFIILEAKPGVIIDPYYRGDADNNYRGIMSGFGTGKPETTYAVTKISDASGVVYYDKSAPTRMNYMVNFTADVDLKIISDMIANPADATGRTPTVDESDLKSLELKGTAFTDTRTDFTGVKAKTVAFVGSLAALLKPENLEEMKKFGTGTAAATYAPATVKNEAGDTLWTKADPMKRFKVEFTLPVNLRIAQEQVARKMGGVKYVGLAFTDTPPSGTGAFGRGSMAQLGAADYSTINVQSPPDSQFPTTFLASGESAGVSEAEPSETPAAADFTASTTYVDPRSQARTNVATGTGDFSRYVSTVTPLTNRIKVRGQWSVISKPGVIATFGIAAGKGSDGTYPKVVEILDYKEQKVWPTGNYVDTGMSELFTIGYDMMIDPKMGLEDYIRAFMPSVTYVNPAMPRVDA